MRRKFILASPLPLLSYNHHIYHHRSFSSSSTVGGPRSTSTKNKSFLQSHHQQSGRTNNNNNNNTFLSQIIRSDTKSEFFEGIRKLKKSKVQQHQDESEDLITTSYANRGAEQRARKNHSTTLLQTTTPAARRGFASMVTKKVADEMNKQKKASRHEVAVQNQRVEDEQQQQTSSLISFRHPPLPWAYVRHNDSTIEHDAPTTRFLSIALPPKQSFRTFLGRKGLGVGVAALAARHHHQQHHAFEFDIASTKTSTTTNAALFPLVLNSSSCTSSTSSSSSSFSYLYQRISKPLEPLFDEFPDLVLEGNIARVDVDSSAFDEERKSPKKRTNKNLSTSSYSSTIYDDLLQHCRFQQNNDNNNDSEAAALLSGVQFYVQDIARWPSTFQHHLLLENNFEIRSLLLYKMLKFCVDPKFTVLPASAMMSDVTELVNSFKQASLEHTDKPICFLGNLKVEMDDENTTPPDAAEDILLNECEVQNEQTGVYNIEGVIVRTTASSGNVFYIHVHREEAEYKCVDFVVVNSNDDNDDDDEKAVIGIKCQTNSGKTFEAPLHGVSNEIRKKLWEKRHSFFSSSTMRKRENSSSTTSNVYAVVEYSSIEGGVPVEPLAKKIIKKRK